MLPSVAWRIHIYLVFMYSKEKTYAKWVKPQEPNARFGADKKIKIVLKKLHGIVSYSLAIETDWFVTVKIKNGK